LTAIPILLRLERVPDSGSDVGSTRNTLGLLLLLGIGSMVVAAFYSRRDASGRHDHGHLSADEFGREDAPLCT
jgi:hypothetical protein